MVVVIQHVGAVEGGVDVVSEWLLVVARRVTAGRWWRVVDVMVRLTRRVSSSSCYLLMKSIKIEI